MKKRFKIFKLVKGYHGQDLAYYELTPSQLSDVTFEVSDESRLETEEEAINAIERFIEEKGIHDDFLIFPSYSKF